MQDFEASPPQSVPQLLLIPSLRGHMSTEGLSVVCRGKWGMSDAAHQQEGQTSDFESMIDAN
jgi:hypothetical protein